MALGISSHVPLSSRHVTVKGGHENPHVPEEDREKRGLGYSYLKHHVIFLTEYFFESFGKTKNQKSKVVVLQAQHDIVRRVSLECQRGERGTTHRSSKSPGNTAGCSSSSA